MDKYNLLLNALKNDLGCCFKVYELVPKEIQDDIFNNIVDILSSTLANRFILFSNNSKLLLKLFYNNKVLLENKFSIGYNLVTHGKIREVLDEKCFVKFIYNYWELMKQNVYYWELTKQTVYQYWNKYSDVFFTLEPKPCFERLFNEIYDAWSEGYIMLYTKDYVYFTYYDSILEKYKKINLKNFKPIFLNKYSKITLEEVLCLLKKPIINIERLDFSEIRMQDPVRIFKMLKSPTQKEALCSNLFLTTDQILALYNSTTSKTYQKKLSMHPNAPNSLKLLYI